MFQTDAFARRRFLKATSAGALAAALPLARSVHAAGSEVLRVGLVGCGGRGTGAAVNALNADPGARLVALADVFPERMAATLRLLRQSKAEQVAVDADHLFGGFDGYRRVIECADVVLLALPTFFHPHYLKACVDAGKHVFCEKIHAVDAPGVRLVLDAGEVARRKGLSVVSGLAWRYDTGARETMARLHDGAIGRIVGIEQTCNTGFLRWVPRQPGWSEMEYQLRDWFNFFWLACDLPGLNAVHNLDKAAWAMHDVPPLRCWGMGGRQTRVGPQYGDAWDHHATVFEYADGVRLHSYCRQQDGCFTEIASRYYGTKGRCDLLGYRIDGENPWR
ncbi:MAG: Gfo/Idh/MocA family oxidoreductase, partial [Thermoguttaceae bacterium]|nr:Gfo/Idh/MocA family oxidoreductase [Thermoguttaceae bacterium]